MIRVIVIAAIELLDARRNLVNTVFMLERARSADHLLARLYNDACCESINAFDYRDFVRADSM